MWRLALYYSGHQEQGLAKSLAESFNIFANSDLVSHLLPVQIIRALCSKQAGIRKREHRLERWKGEIEYLEREARAYV
ncbi:MAG: hypothetical protein RMZ41_027690 [Nostoc sp. DedVER02]|uniref:hypothetical protein n=1 Tax=unclassified Nostoc TaxID=2593658 RepID=UPI002AD4851A|nr:MULTISPECIES: hypothetical protein [unclassified Nostoc]MDZ7985076.1 hypothetical protein [Nostoc sp. DedVER02]MDZ8113111.1 hypothetical protein [Nostoc sp. DedVER01b]